MAKIEQFEDLECWKKARQLVNKVFEISKNEPLKKDFVLLDQFRRAALSVMNNIAEGFERYHSKEFVRFLDYSQSSAVEVQSMLYVLVDNQFISEAQFDDLYQCTEETKKITRGLIRYLSQKNGYNSYLKESDIYYSLDAR